TNRAEHLRSKREPGALIRRAPALSAEGCRAAISRRQIPPAGCLSPSPARARPSPYRRTKLRREARPIGGAALQSPRPPANPPADLQRSFRPLDNHRAPARFPAFTQARETFDSDEPAGSANASGGAPSASRRLGRQTPSRLAEVGDKAAQF